MAPLEPINVYRADHVTSMALRIDVVGPFNGRSSEAKAREVVLACAFEVFVIWLWISFL